MRYTTANELSHFLYDEAILREINPGFSEIHLVLDNVKITPENSQNRDIQMMRTNNLDFTVSDYSILSIIEEGYSAADADVETVPNRVLPTGEYNDVFEQFVGMFIDDIEKSGDKYIISLREKIRYCIQHEIYDMFEIDALLFDNDQPTLGSSA